MYHDHPPIDTFYGILPSSCIDASALGGYHCTVGTLGNYPTNRHAYTTSGNSQVGTNHSGTYQACTRYQIPSLVSSTNGSMLGFDTLPIVGHSIAPYSSQYSIGPWPIICNNIAILLLVSYTLHMGYVDWALQLRYGIRGCTAVHLLLTCVFLPQRRTRYVIIPRLVSMNNSKNIFHRKIFFSAFVSAYPEGVSSPCATVQLKTLSPITFCEELRPVPVVSPLG